jgi:hypothetical protein
MEKDMSHFTFELAFDWKVKSKDGGVGRIYPLQANLVTNGQVISTAHVSQIKPQDTLDFRIYDISQTPVSAVEPKCLQVLFDNATVGVIDPFTPFGSTPTQVPSLTFTVFGPSEEATPTVAYAPGIPGWNVPGSHQTLDNSGRFELRMLLTVAVPDKIAKFYFVDPEVIICTDTTC